MGRPTRRERAVEHTREDILAAAARVFALHKGAGWLPASATELVLQAYGIPFAPSRRVETPGDAVAAVQSALVLALRLPYHALCLALAGGAGA